MKSFVHILAASAAFMAIATAHGDDDSGSDDHDDNDHHSGTISSTSMATKTGDDGVTHTHPSTSEPPSQEGCPTVTVTGELCSTCAILECLVLSTVTQKCDCPETIPTVTLDFPCEENCSGLFCPTTWAYETKTCEPTDSSSSEEAEPTGSSDSSKSTPEPTPTPEPTESEPPASSSTSPAPVEPNVGNKQGASVFAAVVLAALGLL